MAGEWCETTLGEVTDFLSGGTPSKARADYWIGSIPWVSAKDMKRLRLEDTEDHISEDAVGNGTRLAPAGSILLLTRGMTLLKDVPICVLAKPMTFNQDVKALRPKPGVRSDFLPYLLLGNKERLVSLVDLAGHGTGRLNSDELKALNVQLPPEHEQRAVAHILGTLDDKIELNRRMNETLEAMARALFKSWFVDFDPVRAKMEGRDTGLPREIADLFPARLVDSELGEVPEGWEVQALGENISLSRDSIDPGSHPHEVFDHFSIPAFDSGGFPAPDLGISIKSQKLLVDDECVLVSKLNPATPRIWLPPASDGRRRVASTEFLVCTGIPRQGMTPALTFCLASSTRMLEYLTGLAGGTSNSHQRVRPQDFLAFKWASPPAALRIALSRLIEPLFAEMASSRSQSRNCAAVRDVLLPKLISGEVRVKDADHFLAKQVT